MRDKYLEIPNLDTISLMLEMNEDDEEEVNSFLEEYLENLAFSEERK